MNELSAGSDHQDGLRSAAQSRIKSGTAPPAGHGVLGIDAMAVLHRLASEAGTASDSLKLLHELQTYQVELDLQQEQLLENEREMARQLAYYKGLYDAAPAGYLVVDLDGQIRDCNQAAAELFAVSCGELQGGLLQAVLAPESRLGLVDMQKKLLAGEPASSCAVSVGGQADEPRRLRIDARVAPGHELVLMTMCECDGASPD